MAILDVSKILMHDFYYGHLSPIYKDNFKLLYTDTDSFIFKINTHDVYKDIKESIHKYDTSDYPEINDYGMPRVNKKVIGLMKDECNGSIITEFASVRSKVYSFLVQGKDETKKLKGVKKHALRRRITFKDYKDCLFNHTQKYTTMQTIKSYKHQIFSSRLNKLALSPYDEKRFICEDGVSTYARGHYKIPSSS